QDFDYAQRAVRLGAYDFIVKPVRNDELERVIALAVMELENRHLELSLNENMTEAINRLEERHQSSLPFLRSKFISEQIGGARASETEAYIISEQLGISCSRIAVL
ncbi:hypothetical protein K0U00_50695, partial [Paenibacillus sepulcri]|nr:hypothetical protein [Paenibacillus sepulcri]